MIKESNLVENGYKLVFDLKASSSLLMSPEYIQGIHKDTLNTTTSMGLKGDCGLYATDEWWGNIENGYINTYVFSGTIIALNEENPFMEANKVTTIKLDGQEREVVGDVIFTNEEVESKCRNLYKVGNRIVTFYILEKLKEEDTWNWIVEDKLGIIPIQNKIYIKEN